MVRRAMPPSAAPLDAGQFGRDADTRRTETYGSCSPKPSLDLASQVTAGRDKPLFRCGCANVGSWRV
ncbi:hypothetical protein [uncultured Tateyamaria sp.]|uniref:hypothetical protein n=1 Tax=uncultured Tateyamaria sp. TaxID=455651 RepID=UPI002631AD74|nr:hypothetical protein [uncultured Tateyamaria sp.]